MKILITGGCGFLGSNLAAHAIECGHDLLVFDNLSRFGSSSNLDWLKEIGKFTFINGDIREFSTVSRMIEKFKPDIIFHLSGQVAVTTSILDPRIDFETNVLGAFNLLEGVRNHAPQAAVLFSSSNKVYGDLRQYHYEEAQMRYNCLDYPCGFDENVPLDFRSPYGCSKGAADQYFLDYARVYGLKTAVFRHSSMYGGRQFASYDQGWIGWFCKQVIATKRDPKRGYFTISGDGKQVRDVLHVDDIISLYFTAVEKIEDISGGAFNVGGGWQNSLSLLELLEYLKNAIGVECLPFKKVPWRQDDQLVFVADIKKINSAIGWFPKTEYRFGLESYLNWVDEIYAI